MKTTVLSCVGALLACTLAAQSEPFTKRVVASSLSFPWEITMGPDAWLWVTERTGKTISRINPTSGTRTVLTTITEVYQTAGQDGLMGMALHPNLLQNTGEDWVYAAYTYDADITGTVNRKTKIVRFTYNSVTNTLGSAVTLISNMPASDDHNSGRLKIGPDAKLYYTVGDMGANQFGNKCLPIQSQTLPTAVQVTAANWAAYAGKILRLNDDGSIPADNPVLNGVRSHVYSYGHRNAQGLVFAPDGTLYADEHGPKSDDEINIIKSGKNYGWPFVAGYNDDKAYIYGNWSGASNCSSLTFSDYSFPASVPQQSEHTFTATDFEPPIRTLFTVNNGYNFQDPACNGNYFICWPTVGPSSLDIYTKGAGGIPGWASSLLVVSLKKGRVYRLKLSADGKTTTDTTGYFITTNRYRDIAVSADGTKFYVATDNSGSTSGPTSGYTSTLANPGAILEFAYTGTLLNLPTSVGQATPPQQMVDARFYPNPMQQVLQYNLGATNQPYTLTLCNADGQQVLQQQTAKQKGSMPVHNLPQGVYLLTVTNKWGQTVATQKLMK